LIVAPYKAQVFKLSETLPTARIGTVDKFQGQEAPVVIYSITTSSPEDAPRGVEFLYSLTVSMLPLRALVVSAFLSQIPAYLNPNAKLRGK
jgi:hypothetical protein